MRSGVISSHPVVGKRGPDLRIRDRSHVEVYQYVGVR
jgi:hypothetical protein